MSTPEESDASARTAPAAAESARPVSPPAAPFPSLTPSSAASFLPDSEAPGRIVGALARLFTDLRLIGAGDEGAWRVTVKTGLDSMPAARLRALDTPPRP